MDERDEGPMSVTTSHRSAILKAVPRSAAPLLVLIAAALLTACGSGRVDQTRAAASAKPSPAVLPDMGAASPLDLKDAVSGSDLVPQTRGKVVLLSFIATTCKEACPVIEAKFAAVQTKLSHDGYLGSRAQIVLVGMDPTLDTSTSLAALAKKDHAKPGAFHFATGSESAVRRVLHDYGIEVSYHGTSHVDPDHSVAIYLVDPAGRLRYDFAMFYPPAVICRIVEQLADQTTPKGT
jgi:protein SCO1/2